LKGYVTFIRIGATEAKRNACKDLRVKIKFSEDSGTYKKVIALLELAGLVDPAKEFVVHVLIIYGGTEMQCPHADHPRVYCKIVSGGRGKVAYELD
jgi:hypothetical protein